MARGDAAEPTDTTQLIQTAIAGARERRRRDSEKTIAIADAAMEKSRASIDMADLIAPCLDPACLAGDHPCAACRERGEHR